MKSKGIAYKFTGKPWQYTGQNAWYFVSVPKKLSAEIRKVLITEEEGWGRLKATAQIGSIEWKTAIWFDTKLNTYLLPLKAEIRKKETITVGKPTLVTLWL